jgi:ABC-2 type transport system permease protein
VRVIPLAVASAGLLTTLHLCIGLLAFWLEDVTPVYWVAQKLLFVLGGLMMPIELYPDVIRRIAAWTPFPSMLDGPASYVLTGGGGELEIASSLAIWGGLAILAVYALSRRVLSTITINGG